MTRRVSSSSSAGIESISVLSIADQLVSLGKVVNSGRAALGIHGATGADTSGQPVGVIVSQLTAGGPAAKAGIQAGDVIIKINGQPTPMLSALQALIAGLHPGDIARVTVIRPDGSQHTFDVTPGDLSAQ